MSRIKKEGVVKHRNTRQDVIRELVRSESIRTQRDLVDMLKDRGFACTQATVSRDTAEMDLQNGRVSSIDEAIEEIKSRYDL